MPARDVCEPQMVRALEKEGWSVIDHQYSIEIEAAFSAVYADLRLQRGKGEASQQIIVVEVKCFANPQTELQEVYRTIGQYVIYQSALLAIEIDTTVYVAVPVHAYEGIFSKRAVRAAIDNVKMKMIVVDLEKEEVVEWLR